MSHKSNAKKYSDTYLYTADVYETKLVKYITTSELLDKNSDKFIDIMNMFKNTYPRWMFKFINSDKLQFLIPDKHVRVNKSFNGFACVKDKELIAFVNAYILGIHIKTNKFVISSTDEAILKGYVVSAFTSYTYLRQPSIFTKNSVIVNEGSEVFTNFFTYILHYMYKIKAVPKLDESVRYMVKMYYFVNLLGYDINKATQLANKKTKLTSLEIELLNADDEAVYENINTFITKVIAQMDLMGKITTAAFIEKWIALFGNGTEFALEMLPAFLTMLTNHYVSSYATNINLVQNVMGRRNKVGAEVMQIGVRIYG